MIQRYNKILHHFLLWIQQITCNDTLDALCGRSFMSNILTGGSYYGYQIRCSIILVYIAFHCLSNSITFYKLYRQPNPLNYNSQIRTRCTIWYMSLWNTLSFDYSFVTISWRNKNISLIKIQSITKKPHSWLISIYLINEHVCNTKIRIKKWFNPYSQICIER